MKIFIACLLIAASLCAGLVEETTSVLIDESILLKQRVSYLEKRLSELEKKQSDVNFNVSKHTLEIRGIKNSVSKLKNNKDDDAKDEDNSISLAFKSGFESGLKSSFDSAPMIGMISGVQESEINKKRIKKTPVKNIVKEEKSKVLPKEISSIEDTKSPKKVVYKGSEGALVFTWKLNERVLPDFNSKILSVRELGNIVLVDPTYEDGLWIKLTSGHYAKKEHLRDVKKLGTKKVLTIKDQNNLRRAPVDEKIELVKSVGKNTELEIYPLLFENKWYMIIDGTFIHKSYIGKI